MSLHVLLRFVRPKQKGTAKGDNDAVYALVA